MKKDQVNVSSLSFSSHTGTLPNIFSLLAKVSKRFKVRSLLVDPQFWKCRRGGAEHGITASDLDGYAGDVQIGDMILLYTGSNESALQDDNARRNFSYLEESAADWIVNHKVKCVGIDSFRVENYGFVEGVVHKNGWQRRYYGRTESTVKKFCWKKDVLNMPAFVA